jgi:hypothetical protein
LVLIFAENESENFIDDCCDEQEQLADECIVLVPFAYGSFSLSQHCFIYKLCQLESRSLIGCIEFGANEFGLLIIPFFCHHYQWWLEDQKGGPNFGLSQKSMVTPLN